MALIDLVRQRLGIFYSDTAKDAEINQMIAGAKAFLISAGAPASVFTEGQENPEAVEAIIIYCKMAQNTDPVELRVNPILVAIADHLRTVSVEDESV